MAFPDPAYVLQLKYFDNESWLYVSQGLILDSKELKDNLKYFTFANLKEPELLAQKVVRQREGMVEMYKIIKLSRFPPHPEFSVERYQKYKKPKQ
jgi:hypothetical protein